MKNRPKAEKNPFDEFFPKSDPQFSALQKRLRQLAIECHRPLNLKGFVDEMSSRDPIRRLISSCVKSGNKAGLAYWKKRYALARRRAPSDIDMDFAYAHRCLNAARSNAGKGEWESAAISIAEFALLLEKIGARAAKIPPHIRSRNEPARAFGQMRIWIKSALASGCDKVEDVVSFICDHYNVNHHTATHMGKKGVEVLSWNGGRMTTRRFRNILSEERLSRHAPPV